MSERLCTGPFVLIIYATQTLPMVEKCEKLPDGAGMT